MTDRPFLEMNKADKMITFIYYKNLARGEDFYGKVLGFSLIIDQGFCKIFQISDSGYLGVVDETQGMQDWHPKKSVQICIRVPEVMPWYEYCRGLQLPSLSELFVSEKLKIKAFVFDDPEGYQIEFQESLANDHLF